MNFHLEEAEDIMVVDVVTEEHQVVQVMLKTKLILN